MRAVTMRGASVSGMSLRLLALCPGGAPSPPPRRGGGPIPARRCPCRGLEPDRPAHAAEGAVRRHVAGQPAGAKVVDELVERGGAHVAEEPPVDGEARRPAAVGDALDL